MTAAPDDEEIVIQYRLRRDEYPRLFADLAARKKGIPRASRLKVLALRGFDLEGTLGDRQQPESTMTSASQAVPISSILGDLIDGKTE